MSLDRRLRWENFVYLANDAFWVNTDACFPNVLCAFAMECGMREAKLQDDYQAACDETDDLGEDLRRMRAERDFYRALGAHSELAPR